MTNGTSQGLFIVVAIVIFGIFAGISYTLFGSEGLSNGLENLFTNSMEQQKPKDDAFTPTDKDIDKCLTEGNANNAIEDENYTYTFNSTCTEVAVSKYTNDIEGVKVLIIPERYKGIPVTKINNLINGSHTAEDGFKFPFIRQVILPDTITEIGSYSFLYSSIEKINFPKNLKTIGYQAFDTTKLGNVVLPQGIESIEFMAFRSSQLTSINLPNTLKYIGPLAFSGFNKIEEYKIPDSVTEVGFSAFQYEENPISTSVYFNSEHTYMYNTNAFYANEKVPTTSMVSGKGTIYDIKTGKPVDVTIRKNTNK